jgi:predicted Zn finger-like uncharacterized protein
MLITCDGCGATIRVPDSAAGKRAKCPKCGSIVKVPQLDQPKEDPDTKVSEKPMPPPAPIEVEPLDEDEKTKVTASGTKPPKIKPKPAEAIDEDDDDEPIRKRRWDEGEDDYLAVRSGSPGGGANTTATAAMVLGIVSIVMSTGGVCCCSFLGPVIAIICGGLAVALGFMGRGSGSNGTAMAGIICGGIGLALGLMMLVLIVFAIGLDMVGQQGMFNFNPNG